MLWNGWPACVAGDAIAGGGAVLVHCSSGVSRSGTVVLAYLIARCGLLLKDAWELVSARRRVVLPNNLFHRVGAAVEQSTSGLPCVSRRLPVVG